MKAFLRWLRRLIFIPLTPYDLECALWSIAILLEANYRLSAEDYLNWVSKRVWPEDHPITLWSQYLGCQELLRLMRRR